MKKVFICHSSNNKKQADYLFDTLTELGINSNDIFYSSNIQNGVEVYKEINSYIHNKISESDFCIALLSNNFFESNFCLNEIGAFWILKKPILPIIVDELNFFNKIDLVLSDRFCVDLKNGIEANKLMLKEFCDNLGIENNQKNLLVVEDFRQKCFKLCHRFSLDDISFEYSNKMLGTKIEKLKNKLRKPITNSNDLESFLNEVLNSKIFLTALVDSCNTEFSYENVTIKISNVINYYLLTRNFVANYYILFDIMNSVNIKNLFLDFDIVCEGIKKVNPTLTEKLLAKKLLDNYLFDGYVAHSCNPIYLANVLKNGLGTTITDDVEKNLSDLENTIHKNKFLSRQENSSFYYTIPSANAVHYSIGLSPERVFGGPLKILNKNKDFDEDTSMVDMPYIYAFESIKHYFKRIAKNNLNILLSGNKTLKQLKPILKKKLYKLVDDFCFDYSYLLLIPTKKENLFAYDTNTKNNKVQTYNYYLENCACKTGIRTENINNMVEAYNIIKFVMPKNIGTQDGTMMGNLCSNQIIRNMGDVLKIKIPTFFKISQLYHVRKFSFLKKYKIKLNPYFKD